jgi:hypothetical protein
MKEQSNLHLLFGLIIFSLFLHLLPVFSRKTDPDREEMKKEILAQLQAELPALVADTINNQIHELAMDKIKLEEMTSFSHEQVQAMRSEVQYVIKVGEQILDREGFLSRFSAFAARPEFAGQPREDIKTKFVEELKKHYAVIQSCREQGMDKQPEFLQQMEELTRKVFLSELLQKNIKPVNDEDVRTYYQKNLQLYEHSRHFSYNLVEADSQEELLVITSVESFKNSSLPVIEKIKENEAQTPFAFIRALNETEPGSLTEIIRSQNKFYLLLKTAPPGKNYIPIEQVAQFITEHLSFERIREAIDRIANPLKFEYPINFENDIAYLHNAPIPDSVLDTAGSILPPRFIESSSQNIAEKEQLKLKLQLIFLKYSQNPTYFPLDVHKTTTERLKAHQESLLLQTWQDNLQKSVSVHENELREFYESRKEQFVKSIGRLARHIFESDRSKALSVLNMAMMDPANFANLAKTHSKEERTANMGGDMRYLSPEDITPEMNEIVKKLRPGEVHNSLIPGKNGGYHIIRFEQESVSEAISFEQARDQLNEILLRDKRNRAMSNAIIGAMKKYPARVDETLLSKL